MTPIQEQAQLRVEQLLIELAGILGPLAGEPEPGEGPAGQPILREWAVVGLWVDDDDVDFLTVLPAPGMRNHHTTGLLNQAALDYGGLGADR